jgi:hypothetical protein
MTRLMNQHNILFKSRFNNLLKLINQMPYLLFLIMKMMKSKSFMKKWTKKKMVRIFPTSLSNHQFNNKLLQLTMLKTLSMRWSNTAGPRTSNLSLVLILNNKLLFPKNQAKIILKRWLLMILRLEKQGSKISSRQISRLTTKSMSRAWITKSHTINLWGNFIQTPASFISILLLD